MIRKKWEERVMGRYSDVERGTSRLRAYGILVGGEQGTVGRRKIPTGVMLPISTLRPSERLSLNGRVCWSCRGAIAYHDGQRWLEGWESRHLGVSDADFENTRTST